MITITKLSKNFKDKTLYYNFTFTFGYTGLYIINGENGAGKTTLLNLIYGLDAADSGTIYYNDTLINNENIDKLRREEIGYVRQTSNLNFNLTVYENLELSYILKYGTKIGFDQKISEILKKLNCIQLKKRKVNKLSGGEKARINFARCLICDYNVILLDEPTANLDVWNSNDMNNIINEIAKEKLIILISHDLNFIHSNYKIDNINDKITVYEFNSIYKNCKVYNNKNKQKNYFYLFLKYFKKFYLLNFIIVLILSILTSTLYFVKSNKYEGFESVSEYIKDNNILSVKSPYETDKITNLELYNESSILRINNQVLSNLGIDDFYTLDNKESYFYYADKMEVSDCAYNFNSFANNVIIDDTLIDNHIKVTSEIYDFLNYENKIKDNYIENQAVRLYIDSVVYRDYYDYDVEKLINDYSYRQSDEYKFKKEYCSQIWMNHNTYKYLSTSYQGFIIYYVRNSEDLGTHYIHNSYGLAGTIYEYTYESFCGFFPESNPKQFGNLNNNSCLISTSMAKILDIQTGDKISINYNRSGNYEMYDNILVSGIFEPVGKKNNMINSNGWYIVLSDDLYEKSTRDIFARELKYDYNEYYYLDSSNSNYFESIQKISLNGERLDFLNSNIVYNDLDIINNFYMNISIIDKILILFLIMVIIIENLILFKNREKTFYFYRSVGVSRKLIINLNVLFKLITIIFTFLFALLEFLIIKTNALNSLKLESNYEPYLNYKNLVILIFVYVIIELVLTLITYLLYDDKKINIKIND